MALTCLHHNMYDTVVALPSSSCRSADLQICCMQSINLPMNYFSATIKEVFQDIPATSNELSVHLYSSKTLVSVWLFVIFSWAKQCIVGQQFLNQRTSKGLTYRKYPKFGTHDSHGIEILQSLVTLLPTVPFLPVIRNYF